MLKIKVVLFCVKNVLHLMVCNFFKFPREFLPREFLFFLSSRRDRKMPLSRDLERATLMLYARRSLRYI